LTTSIEEYDRDDHEQGDHGTATAMSGRGRVVGARRCGSEMARESPGT